MTPSYTAQVDSADWEAVTASMNDLRGALLPALLASSTAVLRRKWSPLSRWI
jgi:hypothetical protein